MVEGVSHTVHAALCLGSYMNHDDDEIELDDETEELKSLSDSLVGVELSYARGMLNAWSIRVMRIDGQNCIGTTDFNPDRINVAIREGTITHVLGVG
tara:strand:- start:122 stop:412 length:291 start_codon:yes stop_codon:yes gene_type:complete